MDGRCSGSHFGLGTCAEDLRRLANNVQRNGVWLSHYLVFVVPIAQ